MALAQRISEVQYLALALRDDANWELWDGMPAAKPPMSMKHNRVALVFAHELLHQLDWDRYEVRSNAGFLRISSRNYYIPDVAVIPAGLTGNAEDPHALDAYSEPLPFAAEVWSPSTRDYDVATKLRGYQQRGDEEIWYLHPYDPYDRVLTVWRRQPDGSYDETTYRGGVVAIRSLPGVSIDLDAFLDRRRPSH